MRFGRWGGLKRGSLLWGDTSSTATWPGCRGADQVVLPGDFSLTGTVQLFGQAVPQCRLHRGAFGKPILLGGADVVYDAVGSRDTTEDAPRLVRSGGTAVIIGMGHARWVDWDPGDMGNI